MFLGVVRPTILIHFIFCDVDISTLTHTDHNCEPFTSRISIIDHNVFFDDDVVVSTTINKNQLRMVSCNKLTYLSLI